MLEGSQQPHSSDTVFLSGHEDIAQLLVHACVV